MPRTWFKTWIFDRHDPTMLGMSLALVLTLLAEHPWDHGCCRPSLEDGWVSTIWAQALAVMNQQKLAPDVRAAIRSDAAKVAAAGRAQAHGAPQQQSGAAGTGTVASAQGIEPAPRLLQRFSQ